MTQFSERSLDVMKITLFFLLVLNFIPLNSLAMDSDLMVEQAAKRFIIGSHEIDDLTEIHFSDEPTSAEELTALNLYVSQVKELYLSQCEIDDKTIESLPTFPNLNVLSLKGNFLTDDGLEPILKQTALTFLNLYYNIHITVRGISRLLPLGRTINILDLGLTQLKDEGMAMIATHFTNLEDLSVACCGLTDSSLENILSLHKLQRVNIKGNKFSQSALERFLEATKIRNIILQLS
jgi:hypothetical protein